MSVAGFRHATTNLRPDASFGSAGVEKESFDGCVHIPEYRLCTSIL